MSTRITCTRTLARARISPVHRITSSAPLTPTLPRKRGRESEGDGRSANSPNHLVGAQQN